MHHSQRPHELNYNISCAASLVEKAIAHYTLQQRLITLTSLIAN